MDYLKDLSQGSCSSTDLSCLVNNLVGNVLSTAVDLIESDPDRTFIYKYPIVCPPETLIEEQVEEEEQESSDSVCHYSASTEIDEQYPEEEPSIHEVEQPKDVVTEDDEEEEEPPPPKMWYDWDASESTEESTEEEDKNTFISYESDIEPHEPKAIDWVTIGDFTFKIAIDQVREFVGQWVLSALTKFALKPSEEFDIVENLGKRYIVEVLFSKPTHRCPNPLAVANVRFYIHVSNLLPKHYPVMVTYKFIGYKTRYYALGSKVIRSVNFQRFYIDSILRHKTEFYIHLQTYQESIEELIRIWRQQNRDVEEELSDSSSTTTNATSAGL